MNFVNYLIYTKNYSALNSLKNYTKLFRATAEPQVQTQVNTQQAQPQVHAPNFKVKDGQKLLNSNVPGVNNSNLTALNAKLKNFRQGKLDTSKSGLGTYFKNMGSNNRDFAMNNMKMALDKMKERQAKADQLWQQRNKPNQTPVNQKAIDDARYQHNQDMSSAWAKKVNLPDKYNNYHFIVKNQGKSVMTPDGRMINIPMFDQMSKEMNMPFKYNG